MEEASSFVLVNRRMDTPGVVVARAEGQGAGPTTLEFFFRSAGSDPPCADEVRVRAVQEKTGLGVTFPVHDPFKFRLAPGAVLWASSTHDVVCWHI